MTKSLAVTGIPLQVGLSSRPGMQTAIERQGFSLKPCSRIRGRERWHVAGLRGNKRLAAAVEVALRSESGVEEAAANPLTGRVLVRYSPDHMHASVETLIRQALALHPMIGQELSRPVTSKAFLLPKGLLAAELGCSLLKLLVLGGISCPVGGIWCVAGVIVTLRFAAQQRSVIPVRGGRRAVMNQACRVEDNEHRAQVMQHGSDNRVDASGSSQDQTDGVNTQRHPVILADRPHRLPANLDNISNVP